VLTKSNEILSADQPCQFGVEISTLDVFFMHAMKAFEVVEVL
jgi:hypothetical protein